MRNCLKLSFVLFMFFGISPVRAADIALNFCDGWGGPHVAGETVDGISDWVDSTPTTSPGAGNTAPSGTLSGLGSSGSVTAAWYSSDTYFAGQENTSDQQLYRVWLDDGDGGASYFNGDGVGASVTLSGLSNWLASTGQSAYQLRFYRSCDWSNGPTGDTGFSAIDIRNGAPGAPSATALTSLPILQTVAAVLPSATHDGGYDNSATYTDTGISDTRVHSDSGYLSSDTITITIPVGPSGSNPYFRGGLAAIAITAVPEPATWVLGLMAAACGMMLIRGNRGK